MLNKINDEEFITWEGNFRAALNHAEILPQPLNGKLPIWRAVGGPPASAIKAGYAGVPMVLATLGGPAANFKPSVDAYREAAQRSGFDINDLPVATTGLFYAAETTQEAMKLAYPHINSGLEAVNGRGYPKQFFAQAGDVREAMMIGSPQQIIEKMLYQHELYGHQRYLAQLDFAGVPFENIMKNIELIGTKILPDIKKYTKKEA